jgi:hypothetical protein
MIVCLGWGSLIWDPRDLLLTDRSPEAWRRDGPELPIEFVRQSSDDRITLVIDTQSPTVPVLWHELAVRAPAEAIETLREREGNTPSHRIGRWPCADGYECAELIEDWARERGFEFVVWTALPTQLHGRPNVRPNKTEVINYLRGLSGETLRLAKEYVCKAPSQIDTPYRRAIEKELGWSY